MLDFFQVWESCSDAAISFGGGEQEGPLAHIVENDLTVSALTEVEICGDA